jgi:alkanesulfonate monooxygenase SsuD/methylene tetrahydromethanopterin reductase-like flavin-dependent oxidoreductase (luciferase family)
MALKQGVVAFWKNYDRKAVIRAAQLADELGYDSIWIPEAWAYEQFQLLTEIALSTRRIKVATGIANVFSRSAGLLAMSAATLDEISEGRAIIGLGTSGKLVVENFHGAAYEKPLTRLRETIGIMRALWRGERLRPELSSLFDARQFKLEMNPLRPNIPVFVASLQEKAITEIGAMADGWLPTCWPYRDLKDGIALIREGATKAGRDPNAIEVAPFVGVVPMDDVAAARAMIKPLVSFYIGGMGTYYHAMFCRYGFKDTADQVRELQHRQAPRGERGGERRAHRRDRHLRPGATAASSCRSSTQRRRPGAHQPPTGMPGEMTEMFLRELAPR